MAKHGRLVRILFNGFSLSKYLKSAEQSSDAAALDSTNFESTSSEFTADVADGKMNCEGFYRGDATDADKFLGDVLGSDTQSNLLVAPEGWAAVGKRILMMLVDEAKKGISIVATNLVMITAEFQSSSGINAGVLLHALKAETATGNEGSYDNAASSPYGAVAQLHLTAASVSTTLDVKVQHSSDNTVWVDLITFDQMTAAGTQRKSATGTVNRYTRERRTIGGTAPSFTYAVGFARLKKSNL